MTITTESEAMEMWENQWHNVAILARIYGNPRLNIAVADLRCVIATALEARDAMIRNIVSHATGGQITDATVGTGLNNICVAVSAFRNRLWKDAQEAATAERDVRIAEERKKHQAFREEVSEAVENAETVGDLFHFILPTKPAVDPHWTALADRADELASKAESETTRNSMLEFAEKARAKAIERAGGTISFEGEG